MGRATLMRITSSLVMMATRDFGNWAQYLPPNPGVHVMRITTAGALTPSARAAAPEREAHEKSAPFKQGQRFRAGIEGRISVLSRGRGMKRCLVERI